MEYPTFYSIHATDPTPRFVFIDGNSFVHEMRSTMEGIHGSFSEIDFQALRSTFDATRLYWCDSLLDVQTVRDYGRLDPEKRTRIEEKVRERAARHDAIAQADGFVIKLGTTRASVKQKGSGYELEQREKEVDVLLAVESMIHAANRNMRHAVIIGGDLDHRPLVQALMQLGVYVTVYGHPMASAEIKRADDSYRQLNYDLFYFCSTQSWKLKNPAVERNSFGICENNRLYSASVNAGTVNVEIVQPDLFHVHLNEGAQGGGYHCRNLEPLLKFAAKIYGVTNWTKLTDGF